MSNVTNTLGNNQFTGAPVSLTQEQLNQILSLSNVNNNINAPAALKPPPTGIKKALCWPELNGTKESYEMYMMQLAN
ncbi:Bgt-20287 [Blumeria graminis f. sp. tritici]|uniref:Bgt-20287 n=2 Tax=Blumeria graminis f. sp. tritici TaxID=62690 RepID=A0A381L6L8_BLUGR|nr:Bgt-20287 [Blumeria graminis f. sp. tritici]